MYLRRCDLIEFNMSYETTCAACGGQIKEGDVVYAQGYDRVVKGEGVCRKCLGHPDIPIRHAIKIDPDSRYIFIVPVDMGHDDIVNMKETLHEWWESGDRFLWAKGNLTLIRLGEDGKAEVLFESKA